MYGVARLYSLRVLNLSHNNIVSIEGLKDMKYLTCLNLAGNNIKNIEHLTSNSLLEILDLSDNAISCITDLSHMKNLKKLHLHSNRIKSLQFFEKFVPMTVTSLTLAENCLSDLNEIQRLAHLISLENFTIINCPCCAINCDYRPYVLNWIPSLKILDEVLVNPRESLVAEWLYSQGKGRQFKIGQHEELSHYLATVRPDVNISNGTGEENGKLDKILNLARQHHSDLQLTQPVLVVSPTPQRRCTPVRKSNSTSLRKQATPPRDNLKPVSRFQSRSALLSCEDDLTLEPMPALMYQSLDSASLERSASVGQVTAPRIPRPVVTVAEDVTIKTFAKADEAADSLTSNSLRRTVSAASERKPVFVRAKSTRPSNSKLPVQAAKKGVSVPPSNPRVNERVNMSESQAAVTIQKVWRGFQTRNLNSDVKEMKNKIRQNRTEEHVVHLSRELAKTHDLYREQKERLDANDANANNTIDQLRQTCDSLQKQVHELQTSMQQVLDWIVLAQPVPRPRTLPLTSKSAPGPTSDPSQMAAQPVEHFAQGMARRLIQSVNRKETEDLLRSNDAS